MSPTLTLPRLRGDGPYAVLALLASVIAGASDRHDPAAAPDRQIADLRNRDPDAWRRLFESDGDAVYRYVYSRVGSHDDAEDLTGTVFEEAWQHAGSLRDQGLPARAWLFGIARHVVGTHHRRLFRRTPVVSLDAFSDFPEERQAAGADLDVAAALTRLKPHLAEVVTLRFIHGLSLRETAAVLQTTVDAVKRRQARGIDELRDRLRVRLEK